MSKQVRIEINRNDKPRKQPIIQENDPTGVENNINTSNELSAEDLYAKEFELVLDGYIDFSKTYKEISKKFMNPFRFKKEVSAIYEELNALSERFNRTIREFRDRANPPEDLIAIHKDVLTALEHFEVYNDEFPELMMSGNFKRVNTLSRGLEEGHRLFRMVIAKLDEREKQKD